MNRVWDKLPESARDQVREKSQPDFVTPMKATLVHEYFSDPEWLYERKLDGERSLIHKESGSVSLLSRNRKEKGQTYPEIRDAAVGLPGNFILDAELVTFEGKVTSFKRLQKRMHVREPGPRRLEAVPVYAYVFDVVYLDGYDLTNLSLNERKRVLKGAFDWNDPIRLLPYRRKEGEAFLAEACSKGWEGLIAKDGRSRYLSRRSRRWLKFKCGHRQEVVIGGFTEPKGSRVGFGALLLGYFDQDGDFLYAGKVGTGFDDAFLESFRRRLDRIERETSPYKDFDSDDSDTHWVRPEFVGEVGFTEWTREGRLRHPRFLGLRDDKKAAEVTREGYS